MSENALIAVVVLAVLLINSIVNTITEHRQKMQELKNEGARELRLKAEAEANKNSVR